MSYKNKKKHATVNNYKLVRPYFYLVVTVLFYLIISNDGYHHWDDTCYLAEASYGRENGFACLGMENFRLHIWFISMLVDVVGNGIGALRIIDFFYAILMLLSSLIVYLIVKELFKDRFNKSDATYTAIIFLFLPITLYLGYKTLTEVSAFLLVAIAVLLFVYSFRCSTSLKGNFLVLVCSVFAYLSGAARTDAPIIFFSFVLSLIIMSFVSNSGFKREELLYKSAYSAIVFIAVFSLILVVFGYSPFERFIPLKPVLGFSSVEHTQQSAINTAKNTLMGIFSFPKLQLIPRILIGGGLLYLFVFFAVLDIRKAEVQMPVMWYLFSILPTLLMLKGHEVRYYYLNTIPLSILIYLGIKKVYSAFKGHYRFLLTSLIVALFLINTSFVSYMETAIDERSFVDIITYLDKTYTNYVLLVPSAHYSDYAFLRFTFPDKKIYAVQTFNQDGEDISGLLSSLYKNYYIGNMTSLKTLNEIKVYVCPEKQVYPAKLKMLVNKMKNLVVKSSNQNNKPEICSLSWMWTHDSLLFTKVYETGPYSVYIVELKNE